MLRPALRTSHSSACGLGSGISTTLPGRPRSPISSTRRARSRSLRLALLARELDQQDGLGIADQGALDDRPEGGIGARQLDHGAIDQLDRRGPELDDVLGAVHRLVEAREVHDAQGLVLGQRARASASGAASRPACLRCRPAGARGSPNCRACRAAPTAGRRCRGCSRATRRSTLGHSRSISSRSAKASAATLSAMARTAGGMSSGRAEPKRARSPSARMASIEATLCTMLP